MVFNEAPNRPPPLTPNDCDVSHYPKTMVDRKKLQRSSLLRAHNPEAFRAGMLLMFAAFEEYPAASMPDDDWYLAQAASFGRDQEAWKSVKAEALADWVLCSDGRWYHRDLAEEALECWATILLNRHAGAKGAAARWRRGVADPEIFDRFSRAADCLRRLNPDSAGLAKISGILSGVASENGIRHGDPNGGAMAAPLGPQCRKQKQAEAEAEEQGQSKENCQPPSRLTRAQAETALRAEVWRDVELTMRRAGMALEEIEPWFERLLALHGLRDIDLAEKVRKAARGVGVKSPRAFLEAAAKGMAADRKKASDPPKIPNLSFV